MEVIKATNINDAWPQAKTLLQKKGVLRPSRVGDVLEVPGPVTTEYLYPAERVLFDEHRDANPFFHFFEGLWMLAGRNDVAWIKQYNARMDSFSDDKAVFWGAYGHRWRHKFGIDQLKMCIDELKRDPTSRRVVLQMWSPDDDLCRNGLDLPCNTNVYFKIRDGRLHMTVCNRSNDIVWGCYGANVVHMSMLMEYVASMVGDLELGSYHQVSDSWHGYMSVAEKFNQPVTYFTLNDPYGNHPYFGEKVKPYPMVDHPESFDEELQKWMENPDPRGSFTNKLLDRVARPMHQAWLFHKEREYGHATTWIDLILATDWQLACRQWLQRRETEWKKKNA